MLGCTDCSWRSRSDCYRHRGGRITRAEVVCLLSAAAWPLSFLLHLIGPFFLYLIFSYIFFFSYIFRTNGKTFTVPRDDVHVPRLSLGDIVSFSYYVNTRHDIPTRPSVYRIRTDVEWDDVITSARSDWHRSSGKP